MTFSKNWNLIKAIHVTAGSLGHEGEEIESHLDLQQAGIAAHNLLIDHTDEAARSKDDKAQTDLLAVEYNDQYLEPESIDEPTIPEALWCQSH